MAWTFSAEVIDLYIKQYANGTITYIDENGQEYIPITTNLRVNDNESVINTNIDIERAIIFAAISLCLVILGGITSGLNVSLLSIDAKKNQLMIQLSKKNSHLVPQQMLIMMEKLQPLINDRHLLLVTLLVANASCMEALPIFLDELVASWLAIVISVTFVLIFGEILPQALFTADPLKSGYKLYYIVLTMKWLLFPICKPLALLLDCILSGEHQQKGIVFSQKEVSMIMDEIQQHPDERTVVEGALKIANYTVMESIIPWKDVICFDANTKLDANGLKQIYRTGFSRIPIYENRKDNIIGILLVKTLILCDPDPDLSIKEYLNINFKKIPPPALVQPTTSLYDCINIFQAKKTHFAMVCDQDDEIIIFEAWRDGKSIPKHVEWIGIITLEDIMEDIIQEEIADEFDAQSPLQAILESKQSRSLLKPEPEKWTDDTSFVESVKSRFNAKNIRTARAARAKLKREGSNMRLSQPPLSPLSNDNDNNIFDQVKRMGSQSQPEILTKPLLSNNSINTMTINVNPQSKKMKSIQSSPQMI